MRISNRPVSTIRLSPTGGVTVSHAVRRLTATVALSIATLGVSALATSPASAASQPNPSVAPAPPSTNVQISQVSTQGLGGSLDEFVELQNVQASPLDISGYTVYACSQSGQQILLATIPQGTILQGTTPSPEVNTGRYYLLANAVGYNRVTPPDQLYTGDIQRLGGVLLRGTPNLLNPQGARIDSVGFAVGNACTETAPAPAQSIIFIDQSDVRLGMIDTNVNTFDFTLVSPAFPRNSSF